jgi:predicted NAD-dependent protein-ADP-ribosyltransferase YbiA (DUF1768 family)
MAITSFKGKYGFLSNFMDAKVMLDGMEYPSVENAYQAAKTTDPYVRTSFVTMTAVSRRGLVGMFHSEMIGIPTGSR